ncbi:CrcB family protein [Haloarcula litorea]|uniref:CrcB family protein n=1 Tax=Haloarcula litorea TaxID=3032579 RepID=UPI0023E7E11C|nr:CrcB family protein [Halomicroarcula sp. GDY20]
MTDTHPLAVVETVVLVGIGGFAGSNLRYFVAGVLPGLPGTLLVNAAGSFALGVLVYEAHRIGVLADETSLAASTGFLSSFTTYSTFALQTARAAEWALLNVGANYALGFAGVLAARAAVDAVGGGD